MKKQHKTFTTLAILIIALMTYSNSYSADDYSLEDSLKIYEQKPRFGAYIHGGYNIHLGDLSGMPGVPSCCPKFSNGSAPGFAVGALFEKPLKNNWGIAVRFGWVQLDGEFEYTEQETGVIDNKPATIDFTHYLTTKIGMLNVAPMVTYSPKKKLNLYAGFYLGTLLTSEYSQYEEITAPSDRGTYLDGTRIRNANEGTITETSSVQAGLSLGVGYEFPLNATRSLMLAPELFYRLNILSPIPDASWLTNSIYAGIALKYKQPPPPPPPPAAPLNPLMPVLPLPEQLDEMIIALNVAQIDSVGNESKQIDVRIEDFVSFNMRPLLNYIFFDENSWKIPERYIQLKKSESQIFATNSLNELDAISTYYHVLNIYGARMRANPNTKITLVGTNCNADVEKDNKELSLRRAETVKKYFTEVWGIDEARIGVQARNLPDKPSRDSDEPIFAYQENRRVEIITDDDVLFEPVITNDTKRSISANKIRFYPEAQSVAGIADWKITTRQNDRELFNESGTNQPPKNIDWELSGAGKNALTTSGEVAYYLEVTDNFGRVAKTTLANLPVEQITINKKRKQKIRDKEFEYYSLILFDFGKYNLQGEHRKVVDFVKSRMKNGSTIYVKGYTDSMGDEETNKRLAQRRADAVGKYLKVPQDNVIGIGETPFLLFDNNLPEGRFYCRTVQIEIEVNID